MMMKNNDFSYHLTKYFSDYLPNQIAASENTIHSYRDTFVQLLEFYKKELHISPEKLNYTDFTSLRIEEFLHWLEKERNISTSTRNQRLAAIHAFFKYIQYRDFAGFEQCADVLSVPFKKTSTMPVNYMTLEEMQLLFSIPSQNEIMQLRDLAIMMVMYESGARVQEIIDLQPSHFRFTGIDQVELHGKGNKTRLVPINKKVASIVQVYIKRCDLNSASPLFVNRNGEKLTRAGIQYIINKYIGIAKIQRPDLFTRKITNHSFRHSKAMHLLESGVNLVYIRDFLGHTSVKTTEIYARSNPKIKEEQLRKNSASLGNLEKYDENEKEDLVCWLKNNL
jgi:site-specific recombinase XerD